MPVPHQPLWVLELVVDVSCMSGLKGRCMEIGMVNHCVDLS